ncbi:MAG: DUF1566 domain-containing protein, partial [Spirochaetia bacterium]|nr:DUF1566 domain-containing protein [Spirochaetia bacterium]
WIAVSISLIIASLWAYWGAIENFHEGWYSTSLWENLGMMFFQYLLFAWVFIILALVSLRFRTVGLSVHVAFALFCLWFFRGASFLVLWPMIVLPLVGLGLLYYVANPQPKRWANRLLIGIPLVIVLAISIPQAILHARRVDAYDPGMQVIEGTCGTLIWAPRGPLWPETGCSWDQAVYYTRHVAEDGITLCDDVQDYWRLPTIEEAVGSMMLHGQNAQGYWDAEREKAHYAFTPDKESPLWDVHSPVIYYWTSDSSPSDDQRAYIIVYNGGVFTKRKLNRQPTLSFRAVREVSHLLH